MSQRSDDADEVLIALGMPLPSWVVTTPVYEQSSYDEPPEMWHDGIIIEARTKHEAKVLAVKAMRADPLNYRYFNNCDCPFTGISVDLVGP